MEKAGVKILIVCLFITGVISTPVLAQVMTSNNFLMEQDSVNFGGGNSASDNFVEEDTMGEAATGYSESDSYVLHAGYQQMKTPFLSLSLAAPTEVELLPSIPGVTGGTASGTSNISVMTTNEFGYTLQINASTTPAMQNTETSTYYFDDYAPAGSDPDFVWSIASNTSAFGFSPEGADIADKYRDSAGSCNAAGGGDTAGACWGPLSTSLETIASTETGNDPAGTATAVMFRAESGNYHMQVSGRYSAGITITAYMN